MSYIIWAAVILFVLFLLGGKKKKSPRKKSTRNKRNSSEVPKQADASDAKEIASRVGSVAQLRALEERYEKALERTYEADGERAQVNAVRKAAMLEKAYELASDRAYLWQFVPDLELSTPSVYLLNSHKVFPLKKIEEAKATLISDDNYWYELDDPEDAEEPDPFLSSLIKFRKVVESEDEVNIQIRKINEICENDVLFSEEYFNAEERLTAGEQWFADVLAEDGLPNAYELYLEGFNSPSKCLEIDIVDYSKRKGIGPKSVAQLEAYQAKVEARIKNA